MGATLEGEGLDAELRFRVELDGLNPSRHRSVVRPQIDIRHVGLSKNRRVNQRETTLFSGSLF